MNMPDNYSQWKAHEREMEQRLARRPVCSYCDNPIQDDFFYEIDCEMVCEECLNQHFRRMVEEE